MPQLIYVTDSIDHLRAHLDWFFGVPDVPLPPPDCRKLDQLYVALTGDTAYYGRFLALPSSRIISGLTSRPQAKLDSLDWQDAGIR